MRPVRLVTSIAFSLAFLLAIPAAAETSVTKEQLIESDFATLLDLARQAYESEDYDMAIEGLTLANRRDPNSRLLLNIARSYERNGDCRTALAYYEAFLRHPTADESLIDSTNDTVADAIPDCRDYSDNMGGRVSLESEPLLASVSINGRQVGTTPMELAGLAPGNHTIEFELEGYEVHLEEIEVVSHEDLTVGAVLEETPEEPEEDEVIEAPPVVEDTDAQLNYAALGLIGGGVALLATGAIFDLVLIPQTDQERNALNQQTQSQEFEELSQRRKTQATVALAGYIGGGLLVAGGAGWLIYDYMMADAEDDTPDWAFAPKLDSNGFGFHILGRF